MFDEIAMYIRLFSISKPVLVFFYANDNGYHLHSKELISLAHSFRILMYEVVCQDDFYLNQEFLTIDAG